MFSLTVPCTSKCNFRTRATGGTFKNNHYTFGEFNAFTCTTSMNELVEILKQNNLIELSMKRGSSEDSVYA